MYGQIHIILQRQLCIWWVFEGLKQPISVVISPNKTFHSLLNNSYASDHFYGPGSCFPQPIRGWTSLSFEPHCGAICPCDVNAILRGLTRTVAQTTRWEGGAGMIWLTVAWRAGTFHNPSLLVSARQGRQNAWRAVKFCSLPVVSVEPCIVMH